jgi:sec-independent protein translocase protein TatA
MMFLGVSLTADLLPRIRSTDMFDSKMLLVILAIALVIFGTKRLRTIGSDLGAAVKGFKQAMNDGESEERLKQLKQEKDADFDATAAREAAEAKAPPKTNA